jgi:hypothetical protein
LVCRRGATHPRRDFRSPHKIEGHGKVSER